MTKILIVDDDSQNLYLLETLLKAHGYAVTSAWNGAEAFALAKKNLPDIIVTDILMPEMDGFELCRRCKTDELLQQIPFIIYTATYTDLKDEQFALSLGADRFVIKPQQPEVLVQIVQEVLAEPPKAKQVSPKISPADEKEVLQRYNEALFRKLEKKVLQLEDVIAKQKRIETELRESEQKYRTLITQSPDGIFIVNLKGTFLAVNRIMCETLKYSEEELLSMSIWDIVPEQYIDLHKNRIADILTGKAPNEAAEYMVKGKDGNLYYVEILSAPYYEGEKLIGFQGIARDITERKRSAEELQQERDKLDLVTRSVGVGLAMISKDYRTLWANKVLRDIFGDVEGKPCYSTFNGQPDVCPGCGVKQVFEMGKGQAVHEQEGKDAQGNVMWSQIIATLVKDKDGTIIAALEVVMPITKRKKAEEELTKSLQKTKKTLNDAINTMVKIEEMRDPYTSGHQQRVTSLAMALAKEMKLDDIQIENLRTAAIIHDIGKMYVPSDILSKPGKLSIMEFNMIKTHSQSGYDIVKGMDFPCGVAESVLQHHERLDGSGYPAGLKGEEIRLEAKIMAVADVVEAMASHRPYRPALGIDIALEEITKNRGRLYDPEVVDTCVKLFKEKSFKFEE